MCVEFTVKRRDVGIKSQRNLFFAIELSIDSYELHYILVLLKDLNVPSFLILLAVVVFILEGHSFV